MKSKKQSGGNLPETLKIEMVDVASLVSDPSNVRKHSQKNLDAIKGSLAKFGQQKPIVVDAKGIVIAGNGTLAGAKELGWKSIAVVRTKLVGQNAMAFALADNRTAELASWDMFGLGNALQALREDGLDLSEIGFDDGFGEVRDVGETIDDESESEIKYALHVSFKNSDDQQDLFTELKNRGFKVKA